MDGYASHLLSSSLPTLDDDLLFLRHFDDMIEGNDHALDLAQFLSSNGLSDVVASPGPAPTENGSGRDRIADQHLMVSNTSRCNSSLEASQDTASALMVQSLRRACGRGGSSHVAEEEGNCDGQAPENKGGPAKGQWTLEEDSKLRELVGKHGTKKWSLVARSLKGRIGKQCRERWHNHLRPNIKTDAWTEEEDLIVIEGHREHGNRWVEIAKRLPGRTENSIKNHWNTNMRRQTSRRTRRKPTDSSATVPGTDTTCSTLLHDYIRGLNLPQPRSKKKGKAQPPSAAVAAGDNPSFGFGATPRGWPGYGGGGSSGAAAGHEEIYGIGRLFHGLGTGDAQVAATWKDVVPQPQLEPPAPAVAVPSDGGEYENGDMDLIEMINMFYEENRIGRP